MTPIIMPQIGQDVETGVITRWTKAVGDAVKKGEVLATVEGDKAAFDIESPADGVLLQIAVDAGKEGRVLEAVGFVGQAGEQPAGTAAAAPAASAPSQAASAPASRPAPAPAPRSAAAPASPRGRVFSSPAARRVARERGISLEGIRGTGPGGRIMKRDVLSAPEGAAASAAPRAAAPTPAPIRASADGQDTVIPFTRMRQIIADRLSLSKSTIPHFYLFQDLDMEDALRWRDLFNQRGGAKVTVTDMIVWAAAATLRDFPRINAHVEQDRLVAKARICVGVATATEDGLLVPAIPDTDNLEIQDLSAEIRRRSQEARSGKLDLSVKGTFTVTSLGMFGTQSFLPIINPPEAAILAVGAAESRPVAVGNLVGVRKLMTVTLACDHRAVNGAEAAQFLARLKQIFADRFVPAR